MQYFIRKIFAPFETAKPSPGIFIFHSCPISTPTYACRFLLWFGICDYFPDRLLIESSVTNPRKPCLHSPTPAAAAESQPCLHSLFLCCPWATPCPGRSRKSEAASSISTTDLAAQPHSCTAVPVAASPWHCLCPRLHQPWLCNRSLELLSRGGTGQRAHGKGESKVTPPPPLPVTCRNTFAHFAFLYQTSEDFLFPDPKSGAKRAEKQHTAKCVNRYCRMRSLQTMRRRVQLLKEAALSLCQGEFGPKISPWADSSLCFHVPVPQKSSRNQRTKRQPYPPHFWVVFFPLPPRNRRTCQQDTACWLVRSCAYSTGMVPCVTLQPLCSYKTRHLVIYCLFLGSEMSVPLDSEGESKELKILPWKKSTEKQA